ncbi:MAG: DNA translocase FtsK 4TM domain-containing protein [Anaerolineales bacterium]|nr:DNA translocase FtsK [Anaerolineales bacterium]MCS7246692.1 DNA translocase FtsK [Anaerolineales bacterium]MDW8160502.1 DNA translocase FtsK 4TM domain-containing protein [Anaerolineales bacterium]MDW8447131.1 DNA translocase FtsK 4TM domain-containing protein [Anaerolineales bacterium]
MDQKLDLLGVASLGVGALSLLSMVSVSRGWLTNMVVEGMIAAFGWGSVILPLFLIALGLWLILRRFEKVPTPTIERIIGFSLLFLNLLAVFHWLGSLLLSEGAQLSAGSGWGGGRVGYWLFHLLDRGLGFLGATIALFTWTLVALILAFDLPLAQVMASLAHARNLFLDWWSGRQPPGMEQQRVEESPSSTAPQGLPAFPLRSGPSVPSAAPVGPVSFAGSIGKEKGESLGSNWQLPELQAVLEAGSLPQDSEEVEQHRARVIEETLRSFGAPAHVVEINRGPVVTQFGVEPDFIETRSGRVRVRVGKIAALADDLALALSARSVRIQAPVPGKGYVGIEVPNEQPTLVRLRSVIESEAFQRLRSPLRIGLGQDVSGRAVAIDLAAMPHLLIAGTTGSGKSVCVNALIACLLLHNTPAQLRLILVDPKRVELSVYNGIPHLMTPVVVELDRVTGVLQWVTREMEGRYQKLADAGCRNVVEYNAKAVPKGGGPLPYLVVVIDELADLMMLAPEETERSLTRLAQLARATGIHLVLATQRPSVDVLTGLIKANFPARIAFAVASGVDSRVILDQLGAERLLGRGDMLFQAPDAAAPIRLQGAFVSDGEILRLVEFWQAQNHSAGETGSGEPLSQLPSGIPLRQMPLWNELPSREDQDPLFNEAVDLARRQGRASISMLQRRLRIGYTRAARLIEAMEAKGILGPPMPGTGTREVLDYGEAGPPVDQE